MLNNQPIKIIAGLGNPGSRYQSTRHNAGFQCLDSLAKKMDLSWQENKKFNSHIASRAGIVLIKPQAFMNRSGQSLGKYLRYHKLLPKSMILIRKNSDLTGLLTVIHDDLDIELGQWKKSADSRSAGHNGVQSVIQELKTKNFDRYRIGIKNRRPEQMPASKYVLQKFSPEEEPAVKEAITGIIQDLGL